MQAAVIHEHGGPEKLKVEAIARPAPQAGRMLVRVRATGINALDIFVRDGMPGVRQALPHVSGGDVAGVVEEVGDEADAHLVGQSVLIDPLWDGGALGEHHWGGLAEFVVAPAANAIPITATTADEFQRYAALPIAYGTAHRMLFGRAGLEPGERLLVLGAAGGVGVACVQFGARHRAHVIACSTSDDKLERLKVLGAHDTINTADDAGFLARVRELTGGTMADVVVDYIGKSTWNTSIRATRRRTGRLLTCGASSGYDAATDLRYLWTREIDIRGSNGWERSDLTTLVELVRDRRLDPVIHAVMPLSRVHDAFDELEQRRALGKVIVVPDGAG